MKNYINTTKNKYFTIIKKIYEKIKQGVIKDSIYF